MKASLVALAGALLIANCHWAMAASTAELAVQGAITPSACSPTLSSNGVIDYGKISARDLNYSGLTFLPKFNMDFAVHCDAPTLFALWGVDNHPQNYSQGAYGFARTSNDKPLGAFYLYISNFLADGISVTGMYSPHNSGQFWLPLNFSALEPKTLTAFGTVNAGVAAPIPMQDLSVSMLIEGFIYLGSSLPLEQEIPIDGSATIEMRYL